MIASSTVGTSSEPIIIEAADGVRKVVGSSVYADIDAGDGGADDALWYLETTSGGFVGSLECLDINSTVTPSGLDLAGNLDANIVVTRNVNEPLLIGGDLVSGRLVQIGKLLNTGGSITLPASGLKGQVVVNANSDAAGGWTGNVSVGGVTLSPTPDYDETASSLGSGAVGQVPFEMHHESCSPVSGTEKEGAAASITLQFYGPVKPDDVTKMPVKVYRYTFGTFNNGVELTDDFDVAYPADGKQIQILPDVQQFRPRYRYKIVPITSSPDSDETLLLCDDLLTSSDVPVAADEYWVDIEIALSMLDMSENEWIDEPDAALWLGDPQDFDGSGAADANDLMLITENLGEPVD